MNNTNQKLILTMKKKGDSERGSGQRQNQQLILKQTTPNETDGQRPRGQKCVIQCPSVSCISKQCFYMLFTIKQRAKTLFTNRGHWMKRLCPLRLSFDVLRL